MLRTRKGGAGNSIRMLDIQYCIILMMKNLCIHQVPVDLVANQIIFGCLLNAGSVCTGSSEENPTEDEISPTGMYSTVFTPLTGAAVLDTNAAAGSIWGTYDSRKIIGCKGRDLKVAAMATYGK